MDDRDYDHDDDGDDDGVDDENDSRGPLDRLTRRYWWKMMMANGIDGWRICKDAFRWVIPKHSKNSDGVNDKREEGDGSDVGNGDSSVDGSDVGNGDSRDGGHDDVDDDDDKMVTVMNVSL